MPTTAQDGAKRLQLLARQGRRGFTSVDSKGQDLFKVFESETARVAVVCNERGHYVAMLRTLGGNGSLQLRSGDLASYVDSGFDKGTNLPTLLLVPKDKIAAELSMRSKGHMALKIYNPAAKEVVGLGDAGASGALSINNAEGGVLASIQGIENIGQVAIAGLGKGDIRAKMGGSNGKPGFFVYNDAMQNVARLSEAPSSTSGYLAIGDPTGDMLVEAGNANGADLVRTGPASRALLPGVPGSFILGKR